MGFSHFAASASLHSRFLLQFYTLDPYKYSCTVVNSLQETLIMQGKKYKLQSFGLILSCWEDVDLLLFI